MIRAFDAFSLPLLRWFDPEDAHRLAVQGLKLLPVARPRPDDEKLAVRAFGLNFPNPVGMAAGFDKNAEVPDALLRLGFGFVEAGTVTPKPQGGNPRPRIFRLERDEAIINRLGFNNDGAEVVLRRLAARAHLGGIVGVNVGANKDSADRTADYVKLIETFAPVASYFTVNVSSPNTPGLRNLQQAEALDDLLARVIDARERVRKNAGNSPVLLKIAPDLSLAELDDVVQIARARRVDGMIVTNTTLSRPSTLREQSRAKESGGLSGRPLFRLSTRMVAETYVRAEGAFPLIGAGGIDSGGAALTKIRAGASLIQLYSALIYKGLGLIEISRTILPLRCCAPAAIPSPRSSARMRRRSQPRIGRRRKALSSDLDFDHHAVACRLIGERVETSEHVVAHMGEDQPLRPDFGKMRLKRIQAEMIFDRPVIVISLRDQKVGVAAERNQRTDPLGIGGVGDDAALGLDPVAQEWTTGIAMHDRKRRDVHCAEAAGYFWLERDHAEIETLFRPR